MDLAEGSMETHFQVQNGVVKWYLVGTPPWQIPVHTMYHYLRCREKWRASWRIYRSGPRVKPPSGSTFCTAMCGTRWWSWRRGTTPPMIPQVQHVRPLIASVEQTGEDHVRYEGVEGKISPDNRTPQLLEDMWK